MANEVAKLTPEYLYSLIEKHESRLKAVEHKTLKTERTVKDIEEEYPLLPPEADDLSKAVKKRGVTIMGGKKSGAYNNIELRRRVYRDIYGEIKRQYGLISENGAQLSYKKLKRKYLPGAMMIIDNYEPPISIGNDITEENDVDDVED